MLRLYEIISIVFVFLVAPDLIVILDCVVLKCFAKSSIIFSLALPFSGVDVILALKQNSESCSSLLIDDFGITRMVMSIYVQIASLREDSGADFLRNDEAEIVAATLNNYSNMETSPLPRRITMGAAPLRSMTEDGSLLSSPASRIRLT